DSRFNPRETNQRVGLLLDYARKQSPSWVQGLLNNINDPGHWAQNELGLNDDDGKTSSGFLAPGQVPPLMGYKWVQFNARPLYGHNLMHPQGYLGGEVSANFGVKKDTPAAKPLAKITLSYIGDDSSSSAHGVDLRGVLNLSDDLTLNAGRRQNET